MLIVQFKVVENTNFINLNKALSSRLPVQIPWWKIKTKILYVYSTQSIKANIETNTRFFFSILL